MCGLCTLFKYVVCGLRARDRPPIRQVYYALCVQTAEQHDGYHESQQGVAPPARLHVVCLRYGTGIT